MNNGTISSLEIIDFDDVYEIEQRAYPIFWKRDVMLGAFNADYLKLKLIIDEKIIGYAFVSIIIDEAHLLNITIDPDWQRQGLGQFLLESIIAHRELKEVDTLFLEVRASNHAAQNLYSKIGFNEIGLRPNYYPNGQTREDAIIMAYTL